jgi:hypothetical protein
VLAYTAAITSALYTCSRLMLFHPDVDECDYHVPAHAGLVAGRVFGGCAGYTAGPLPWQPPGNSSNEYIGNRSVAGGRSGDWAQW